MVEVKKLRTFSIFSMRARPSAEIRVVEVKTLWTFFDFFGMRARPSAEIRVVEVKKLRTFFTIFSMRARPSAEIRVVEVKKLRTFYDFCRRRDPLRRFACRSALAVAPCDFVAREMAFGSCLVARLLSQSRGRVFDSPLVRGSSGLKIAAFKYKRSTQSVLLQLWLENRNF